MNTKFAPAILIVALVVISIVGGVFFVISETQQAMVLRFGELVAVYKDPGLKLKLPFIDNAIIYEKRILDYDLPPVKMITGDRKRIIADVYCRYRIKDPEIFYQSIKPSDERGARMRLEAIISSTLRRVLGKQTLSDLLSENREKIMLSIEKKAKLIASTLGLEIVDIRLVRVELPLENRKAVFSRMIAALIRIAKENRARGAEEAQNIRSNAERERTIMIAEAKKQAQIKIAEGKAKAIKISGKALQKSPKLYEALESYRIYKENLAGSTMVLSADNDLFKYFVQPKR